MRRFSDTSSYNDETSKYDENRKNSKKTRSENIKESDDDDDDSKEEDDEVEANTRANSVTNVAQYSGVSVNAEELPIKVSRSSTKGKSSLAIAAAATSIMFSMPAQVLKRIHIIYFSIIIAWFTFKYQSEYI